MSISAIAASDYRANLIADGDSVTLTDPDGGSVTVKGFIRRTEAEVDPQTNQSYASKKSVITIPATEIEGPLAEGWLASFVDNMGVTVSGRVMEPWQDHTLNYITFKVERFDTDV